ncbi:cupin domain-containing protein [Aerolutibacter ruishenii]|uniref:50S ribosomal protein L16 3-hydroxylase n=1 Tax=Aerolutibacter ruishenii TaxID=686800 RepID=A0A562LYC7_9GAMM|nr:cupin domain-containing protein [Lysobacter ruishenii]TWI12657.1 50S ribosomal protein L16 3-hydroxylase [Lysobacter ruishenii]
MANRKTADKTRRKAPADALPFEVEASGNGPLGMPPEAFLRDYWQKRPLLVRNAFPGFISPIQPEDLAGLACEEMALSRIVMHDRAHDRWSVRTGPFDEAMFPDMPHQDWTLLVQDMDKWDVDIRELLEDFRFLPRWRIDDIMVSFAAPGGSVGAHVDQYDVFLLQAHGHRRWQIDASVAMGRAAPSLAFRPDVELKLLQRFHATHDWVLGPGDMLYLPPNVPHNGVAEDACLTFSVGMRAPAAAELLGDFVDTLAADADESLRYHDPDLKPAKDPYEIDTDAMARAVEALNMLRMNDPERLGDWFGRFMTIYRAAGEVMPNGEDRSRIEIEWDLQQGARLLRHPWTRVAWRKAARGATLFVSGQDYPLPLADARVLANNAIIDGHDYQALSEHGRDLLFALLLAGHYQIQIAEDED